jgi:hypothetical protein
MFPGELSKAIDEVDEFVKGEIANRTALSDHAMIELGREWDGLKAKLEMAIQDELNKEYQGGYDAATRTAAKVMGIL